MVDSVVRSLAVAETPVVEAASEALVQEAPVWVQEQGQVPVLVLVLELAQVGESAAQWQAVLHSSQD